MSDVRSVFSDVRVKLVKIYEGNLKNRFLGNMMLIIKNSKDNNGEYVTVSIRQLIPQTKKSSLDKLSLNKFMATINHNDKTLFFGPPEGMRLEDSLQNKGIGTFAFNELILMLKKICPNYTFLPYEFNMDENVGESEKNRAIAFYSKFGLQAQFFETASKTGIVTGGTPLQLINYYNDSKVKELDLEEFILQAVTDNSSKTAEIETLKYEIEQLKDDTFGGIPKKQFIKYTLITCGVSLLFVLFLIK